MTFSYFNRFFEELPEGAKKVCGQADHKPRIPAMMVYLGATQPQCCPSFKAPQPQGLLLSPFVQSAFPGLCNKSYVTQVFGDINVCMFLDKGRHLESMDDLCISHFSMKHLLVVWSINPDS